MIKKVSYKVISCILVVTMMVVCFQGYSTVSAAKKTTLAKKSISVNVGKKKTIKLKNKSGKSKYTYSSAKKSIAKVTAKGVVTGVKAGTVKITVKETVKKTKKTRKVGIVKVTVKRVDSTLPTATQIGRAHV